MVGSSSTSRLEGCASARASISRPRSPPDSALHRRARLLGLEQEVLHVADDVARLAVDDDGVAAAAGQRLGERRLGVEALAPLVERRHLEIGAELDRATIGRKRAGQHVDQRGLAGAVRPDDADAVAAADPRVKIASRSGVAIALGDMLRLDHQLAGSLPPPHARAPPCRSAAGDDSLRACRSRLQFAQAAHVALAPRGDAVAQPMLLRRRSGGRACGCSSSSSSRIASRQASKSAKPWSSRRVLAAVEPHRGARQIVQEAPVVADHHQRRAAAIRARLPAIRWRPDRDGWSARRAGECRARAPARGRARRGAPRRRTACGGSSSPVRPSCSSR